MAADERDSQRKVERDKDEIKVTDRRLFTLEGDLRGELDAEESVEEDKASTSDTAAERVPPPVEEPGEQPASGRAQAGFEHRSLEEPEGVDFTMLINAMAQPALIFLGEVAHPGTGQQEINLEQARLQIDLLDMLRIKCRGNLTPEEEGLLDRILYQLRMLYVTRSTEPPE